MEEALYIIIEKSPEAASMAMQTLAAIRAKSPIVAQRFERTVQEALRDPYAEFSEDDRRAMVKALAGAADPSPGGPRSQTIRFRATEAEYEDLVSLSEAAGVSISDYIRSRLWG